MGFFNSGIGEGLNQATGTILNTQLKALQIKAENAREGQRLALHQSQVDRQNKMIDMQIAKQQKDDELIPIEDSLIRMGFSSPEEHKHFMEKLNPLDVENIGGVNYISRKSGRETFTKLSSDPEFNISLGNIRNTNIGKSIEQIDAQLGNPESKLKPEQIAELQKQKIGLIDQRTQLANQIKMERGKIKANNIKTVGNSIVDTSDPDNPKVVFDGSENKETNDITEYKFAKRDGYKGSFSDWQMKMKKASSGASGGTVSDKQQLSADVDYLTRVLKDDLSTEKEQALIQSAVDQETKNGENSDAVKDLERQISSHFTNERQRVKKLIYDLKSGKVAAGQLQDGGTRTLEGKTQKKNTLDINQERRWAKEAIAKGADKATVIKNFKARTGQNL